MLGSLVEEDNEVKREVNLCKVNIVYQYRRVWLSKGEGVP